MGLSSVPYLSREGSWSGSAGETGRAGASKSGAYAALGQNQLRGYQLCVKHTNDKHGVLGRKVLLDVEDDRSEPATAARLYEKLIAQDRVDAVLGPTPPRSRRRWPT